MQLPNSSSTALDTVTATSTTIQAGDVNIPLQAAAAPVSTPADARTAPGSSPIGSTTATAGISAELPPAAPSIAADDPVFGVNTFITKAMPGTILTAQGVFATFFCPKEYGYDLITEKLEFQRVQRAPWDERDEYTQKRSISTEMFEIRTITDNELPSWASGLHGTAPDLATMEGGADVAAGSIASVVTTPTRAPSVESLTSPSNGDSSPLRSGNNGTPKAHDDHPSETKTNPPATVDCSAVVNTPASDHLVVINTSGTIIPVSAITPAILKAATVINTPVSARTREKSGRRGPGLFESLGMPKPVLDQNLTPSDRRLALIDHYLPRDNKTNMIPGMAGANIQGSPVKTVQGAIDRGSSIFTPNTTRYFSDCEDFLDQSMDLPSLTPLFKAMFESSMCESKASTAMNMPARRPVVTQLPVPIYAGPSSVSHPSASKEGALKSSAVGTSSQSVSASRKRQIHEVHDISSDEDLEEAVTAQSLSTAKIVGKGKGKARVVSKKQKNIGA